ncbi:MAG: hypothetical protein CAPSK01_003856 [Candidatus Accumulibacter vicinus]|uniref:Uncharacterized protein n=1 Tax=Candidatus Accumulibacter vicinus TaxID=2954382 RepID=A0A084XWS3_9PROT|nr:MAG: hypothetical protein CAPSK01_003856 [Candidatus Accumulibacter vicinus]
MPLDRVAGRQDQRQPALAKRLAQFAPAPFIPQLVVATGRRQQHPQTIATEPAGVDRRRRNPVVERQVERVVESSSGQPAIALHRMHIAWNDEGLVIKARGQGFTRGFSGVTAMPALCLPGNQCAFQQALRIEHDVVRLAMDESPEIAQFTPGGEPAGIPAPTSEGHRDDLVDRWMQTGNVGKGLLDAPVDQRFGKDMTQIAEHRQVVNYVTERRGLYQ